MSRQEIKTTTVALASKYGLTSVPINVEKLARAMGAEIKRDNLQSSLSGFAVEKDGTKFIGVNSNESAERQRFTIAHELGHLFLHKKDIVNFDQGGIMLFRDGHSSDGSDMREIDANRFAAELLMPEAELRLDLAKAGSVDLVGEHESTKKIIHKLAKKYAVSPQAMSIRLTTLYFN
jgi:Zn-dependent peptidase ImmA (M78 family)